MGTRTSKHNRGRKPLYKEHGRGTVRHFEVEIRAKHEKQIPLIRNRRAPKAPTSALEQSVIDFLEQRKAAVTAEIAQVSTSAEVIGRHISGENLANELSVAASEGQLIGTSDRDILLQIYIERKITGGQLYGGRMWQRWKEQVTLQPSRTVDWSGVEKYYQVRGGPSETQFQSMKQRQKFIEFAGRPAFVLLDLFLDSDRTRSDLMARFQMPTVIIEATLEDMLTEVCACFGFRSWTLGKIEVAQGRKRPMNPVRNGNISRH